MGGHLKILFVQGQLNGTLYFAIQSKFTEVQSLAECYKAIDTFGKRIDLILQDSECNLENEAASTQSTTFYHPVKFANDIILYSGGQKKKTTNSSCQAGTKLRKWNELREFVQKIQSHHSSVKSYSRLIDVASKRY